MIICLLVISFIVSVIGIIKSIVIWKMWIREAGLEEKARISSAEWYRNGVNDTLQELFRLNNNLSYAKRALIVRKKLGLWPVPANHE